MAKESVITKRYGVIMARICGVTCELNDKGTTVLTGYIRKDNRRIRVHMVYDKGTPLWVSTWDYPGESYLATLLTAKNRILSVTIYTCLTGEVTIRFNRVQGSTYHVYRAKSAARGYRINLLIGALSVSPDYDSPSVSCDKESLFVSFRRISYVS